MSTQPSEQGVTVQLQNVMDVARQVAQSERNPPEYKTAQLMLKLMNGDASVIHELPTLNLPVALKGVDAAESGAALASETSASSIESSKGLLGLTVANIRDIKTYVKKSLTLKTTEEGVAPILGYDKNAPFCKEHPDFAPAKFAAFYKPFNEHARLWDRIEMEIVAQGNAVQTYGTTFVSHASFVLDIVKTMKLCSTTVEDAELTDPEDRETQAGLGRILEEWQHETLNYQASTSALLDRLTAFQNTLVNALQPSATAMLSLLNRLDLAADTKQLKGEMDTLQMQINAKQKEYDMNCGLAFTGAAGIIGGPLVIITWSVTGGIYGARAEKARKERNALQEQLNQKKTLYNNLNAVAGNVHLATDGIADLGIAVTNAITGLKALSAVWNLLTQYIASAKESLLAVDSKSKLLNFMFSILAARDSWREVPSIAANLLDLFKQADMALALNDACRESRRELQNDAPYKFDAGVWADEFAELNQVIIKPESTVMPTLQRKAAELKSHAASIHDAVMESLPLAIVQAKLVQSASDPSLFTECERRLQDNPSDAEAIEYFNALVENLKQVTGKLNTVLGATGKKIKDNVTVLKANTRTDLRTTGFYSQLNTECKRFEGVIQRHTGMMQNNLIDPMRELEEKMKKWDADIEKKLDPENVMKRFKEFLPAEKELSTMLTQGGKSEEAAAVEGIKLAYSTALKGLDVLGTTIKLCPRPC